MCMKNLTRSAFSLILLIIGPAKLLYSQDSLSVKDLSEIVVTGQPKPQSVKQSVYQVKVIRKDVIQKMGATTLQQVLQNQLNLRFNQDLATGGSNLSMMGLPGQNVKVLIDGMPVVGRQGATNEININQIDIHSIERIEIVEGPMSVIYGADALAGVVNIITKKNDAGKFGVSAQIQEETVGTEYGGDEGIHNQNINAFLNHKKWYVNGGVGRNMFNGWKGDSKDRELIWHSKRQFIGNGTLGYKSRKLQAYYRFDGLDELIKNPSNFEGNNPPALDVDYISQRTMHQIQASYLFNHKIDVNAAASYTHFERLVYASLYYPNGDVRAVTTAGLNSLTKINGLSFRASVQYRPFTFLSFQPGIDVNIEDGEGDRIKQGVQRINHFAFYLTSEVKPTRKLNLKPGIRFIKNSVYDAPPVVPSIHAKYVINSRIDVRAAYARGFRSPSVRELYFDFFDATHSIIGNPGLKAEHSNSYTASVQFSPVLKHGMKFSTVLSGFSNDVENMIDYSSDPNDPVTTYININEYKTRGFNLENSFTLKNISAQLGFGYTGRYNNYIKADKDLPEFKWSPELTAKFSYTFAKCGLTANAFYKFTGKLPYYQELANAGGTEIRLLETASYQWADVTLNKKVGKYIIINAGVKNLFDVTSLSNTFTGGVHSGGDVPIAYGRSYFAGIAFNWIKNK